MGQITETIPSVQETEQQASGMVRSVAHTLVTPLFPQPITRPEKGFDIFEERVVGLHNQLRGKREECRPLMRTGFSGGNQKKKKSRPAKPAGIHEQAVQAYERARSLFGELPEFKRNNARPPRFHFTDDQVQAFSVLMNSDLPSIWYVPEMLYVKDMVAYGLQGGWWEKDKDMSHIPTVDPYNQAPGESFKGTAFEAQSDADVQGGFWVMWQPRLLPLSTMASLPEQERMLKRLVHEIGAAGELCASLGFIADQSVLWAQALAGGWLRNPQILFTRSCTPIRYELYHGSQFRASNTNLGLGFGRGYLEIADYGNQIAMPWIGISPYIF